MKNPLFAGTFLEEVEDIADRGEFLDPVIAAQPDESVVSVMTTLEKAVYTYIRRRVEKMNALVDEDTTESVVAFRAVKDEADHAHNFMFNLLYDRLRQEVKLPAHDKVSVEVKAGFQITVSVVEPEPEMDPVFANRIHEALRGRFPLFESEDDESPEVREFREGLMAGPHGDIPDDIRELIEQGDRRLSELLTAESTGAVDDEEGLDCAVCEEYEECVSPLKTPR